MEKYINHFFVDFHKYILKAFSYYPQLQLYN